MLQSNKKFNPIYVAPNLKALNIVRLKRCNNLIQRNPNNQTAEHFSDSAKGVKEKPAVHHGKP